MGVYKIGANHAGLALLSALSTPLEDPRGSPIDYAEQQELGSGVRQGQGWLVQTWHWDRLSEAQRNKLFTYVGAVNVLTRDNSGNMVEYTGYLVWPEREPEHYADRVLDLTVEIRQMEIYS